ncbi:MAG: proton-conducting transporter membrane subunit [Sulfurimonadaceae bacterium]|jgi:ech hydrogenase subunit A|nr:proton-conducting transporter membrane subunit [Sulfurimonadaceae bacterium]
MLTQFLILSPLLFALIVLFAGVKIRDILTILFVVFLGGVSIFHLLFIDEPLTYTLSHIYHQLFFTIDVVLLLFFLYVGFVKKHILVAALAISQIVLYGAVQLTGVGEGSSDILIDNNTLMMYLIINIVGGIIIIYSLKYIESEAFGRLKKNAFIAMLFFFISVMNFLVSANNIEMFFLLFELTTLCSYILISYRKDEISIANGLKALWMNQIGGVAILAALLLALVSYKTDSFDVLLANIDTAYMIPIVFLLIAAFVKGAAIPFEKWLLGAMVAPTPVSAILHSATMVKIAPFLVLKLSVAMTGFLADSVMLFGTFVFFAASLLALSKNYFKEILGLSTIALLSFMMALAAMGTPESIMAASILMVFHALSKALLFLQMGILEKEFNLKYVNDIESLMSYSPLVVFFIVFGFASLTLPPFGVFIGKFMAFETFAVMMKNNPIYILGLLFTALGSVFLTILYFKVLTKIFVKDMNLKETMRKPISKFYSYTSGSLAFLLFVGIIWSLQKTILSSWEILVPMVLIFLVPVLFFLFVFKKATRVKEYNCGEKEEVVLNMYYLQTPELMQKAIFVISIVMIASLFIGVMV